MATTDSSNLPPYSEMILAAISALGGEAGSSKEAISDFIESTYGDLPPSHESLLETNLARMKESGDLVAVKSNYIRYAAGTPTKRGRGRPPKPKASPPPPPSGSLKSLPRPRGRPPKPKDPLAAAVAKAASGMPRRRGRPPNTSKISRPAAAAAVSSAPAPAAVGSKRGRGRPRKVVTEVEA